jgi:hypothetical protein
MRVSLLVLVALTWLAWPGVAASQVYPTHASSSRSLRVLVWLKPDTNEVLDRIRGQINDLGAELIVDNSETMPSDMAAQLQAAYTGSAQQDISLVIWFVKQPAPERHFVVYIAAVTAHRLLTRDLGPSDADSGGDGLSSAVKESAALVVRAAIQAVLRGQKIGREQATRFDGLSGPTVSNATVAAPDVENKDRAWHYASILRAPDTNPTPNRKSGNLPWAVALELLLSHDDLGDKKIAECALLSAERRMQLFEATVGASYCLARDIDSFPYGTVRIARQQTVLGANYFLLQTWLQASLGFQSGAVFYERETLQFSGAKKESSLHFIGIVGPQFRVRVPSQGSRIQATFTVGLDFLTESLSFGYIIDERYRPTTRISVVEPYTALGLALRL